jgi:hypothetical protein
VFFELVEARPLEDDYPRYGKEDSEDAGDTRAVTLGRRSVARIAAALA